MPRAATIQSCRNAEAPQNSHKAMEYYRLRDKAANASRVLIEDDTCRDAWSNHSMEVTCVKQAFDSLVLSTSAVRSP